MRLKKIYVTEYTPNASFVILVVFLKIWHT